MRRRLTNLEMLAPAAGETIADIGCGPGLLTLDLSRALGTTGSVIGLAPSDCMRETAQSRCAKRSKVMIMSGTVTGIPLADSGL